MLLSSLIAFFMLWYAGLIMAFVGGIIASSSFKLVVDLDKKTIDDFLSILWLKTKHEQFKFQKIKYVIINGSKFKQQLNYKSISSNLSGMLYSAYLVCDDKKHFLGESENHDKLDAKVQAYAKKLGVEVRDHS